MTIGIIGAGNIGSVFATLLARAGVAATIANSRGPASLQQFLARLGHTSQQAHARKRRARTSSSSRSIGQNCRLPLKDCRG